MGALTDPSAPLEDVCDHILNTLDTHHGEDDIALLMARVQGLPADSVGDWTLPREPRSVGRAREYARAQLLAWDMEPLVDTTELLVSELVTNALRYGEGRSDSGCSWTAPWCARSGTPAWSSLAGGAPATPTRAAAASSSSAC